ncbi:MAG: DMT family transporter [Planctomycetes bacterium]|nr:DMT family transporter [Planctomycetota bacterium]
MAPYSAAAKQRLKADLFLLATAAIWGSGFVAQRAAMGDIGPVAFTGVRFFLGWLCIQPFVWQVPKAKRQSKNYRWLTLALGLILLIGAVLQQIGIQFTSASKAGFLTSIYVILTPILAALWSHKIAGKTWAGALLVLGGMYFLSVNDLEISTGDLLVIFGACMWAGQVLLLDYLTKYVPPVLLASRQFLTVAVFCTAYALVFEDWQLQPWLDAAPLVLYSGFFSIGAAFTLQAIAQVHAPPADAAIIMSTEAIFAALFGYLLLAETFTPRELIGCALVLFGVLVSQLRWRRNIK